MLGHELGDVTIFLVGLGLREKVAVGEPLKLDDVRNGLQEEDDVAETERSEGNGATNKVSKSPIEFLKGTKKNRSEFERPWTWAQRPGPGNQK